MTFSKVGTGRLATSRHMPSKSNVLTPTARKTGYMFNAPKLNTANRSRRSINSDNSGDFNNTLGKRVEDVFKGTIDYNAKKGNAVDERLAELIEEYKIRMPVKLIECE